MNATPRVAYTTASTFLRRIRSPRNPVMMTPAAFSPVMMPKISPANTFSSQTPPRKFTCAGSTSSAYGMKWMLSSPVVMPHTT